VAEGRFDLIPHLVSDHLFFLCMFPL